ncbi:MAG: hypothetical protein PHQ64_02320 [Bacilli bacterium]|nr:hypothetical protein [Bacilli bacterium]
MKNKVYFSNGVIIDLDDSQYLGQGVEGKSYRIGNFIFKINHNNCLSTLREYDLKKLFSISTKRFVLPTQIIVDEEDRYSGFVKKHIQKTKGINHFKNIDKKELLEILSLFKEDIIELTNNHFKVDDFNLDNCIFNDEGLFFIDPGFLKYSEEENLLEENLNKLNTFFVEIIYENIKDDSEEDFIELNKHLIEEKIDAITFVEKEMNQKENLKTFSRRIMGK